MRDDKSNRQYIHFNLLLAFHETVTPQLKHEFDIITQGGYTSENEVLGQNFKLPLEMALLFSPPACPNKTHCYHFVFTNNLHYLSTNWFNSSFHNLLCYIPF